MDSIARTIRRRFFRGWRGLISIAVMVCALGYVGISLLSAHILTKPNNRPTTTDPFAISDDIKSWETRTEDGLVLRGWYVPTPAHRRLIVLVHGMGASRDEMADLAHDLHGRGYDVLLFDMRGHGSSDRSRLYMGGRERRDVRAVLGWALKQGYSDDRVGWVGFSMGASTLLMEAAQNGKIHAVVLDSPFGNLPELLNAQLTMHSHLPSFFNPGILLAAKYAYGVRTDDLIPVRSARSWGNRPMLLIHGEADTIVPVQQARQIARVAGPTCQAITLPGVQHVGAYWANPPRYVASVDRFFDHNLGP